MICRSCGIAVLSNTVGLEFVQVSIGLSEGLFFTEEFLDYGANLF
jgi:hypothetical protein